jgi:hypothetical protein
MPHLKHKAYRFDFFLPHQVLTKILRTASHVIVNLTDNDQMTAQDISVLIKMGNTVSGQINAQLLFTSLFRRFPGKKGLSCPPLLPSLATPFTHAFLRPLFD